MTRLSPVRFFLAVRLHAPYALVVCAIVFFLGLAMIAAGPTNGVDDGMGMLLFVQMFLSSSGFMDGREQILAWRHADNRVGAILAGSRVAHSA